MICVCGVCKSQEESNAFHIQIYECDKCKFSTKFDTRESSETAYYKIKHQCYFDMEAE